MSFEYKTIVINPINQKWINDYDELLLKGWEPVRETPMLIGNTFNGAISLNTLIFAILKRVSQ